MIKTGVSIKLVLEGECKLIYWKDQRWEGRKIGGDRDRRLEVKLEGTERQE